MHPVSRKSRVSFTAVVGLVSLLTLGASRLMAGSTSTSYSGEAYVIGFDGLFLGQTTLAATGPISADGGTLKASEASYDAGPIELTDASASVLAGLDQCLSLTAVKNVQLSLLGASGHIDTITASSISTEAWAAGGGLTLAFTQFTGLQVNGQPIAVTGEPNQTISFDGWVVILNEQTKSTSGGATTIECHAMHLTMPACEEDGIVCCASAGVTVTTSDLGSGRPFCGLLGRPSLYGPALAATDAKFYDNFIL